MIVHIGNTHGVLGTVAATPAGLTIDAPDEMAHAELVGFLQALYTGEDLPTFLEMISHLDGQGGYWANVADERHIIPVPDTTHTADLPAK